MIRNKIVPSTITTDYGYDEHGCPLTLTQSIAVESVD